MAKRAIILSENVGEINVLLVFVACNIKLQAYNSDTASQNDIGYIEVDGVRAISYQHEGSADPGELTGNVTVTFSRGYILVIW